jgi:uncharacterized protein (UPF0262 family)
MTSDGRDAHDGHAPATPARDKIAALTIDPNSIRRGNANVEHERDVAIHDILEENQFTMVGRDDGPYGVRIGIADDRLFFEVTPSGAPQAIEIAVPLHLLRRVMKDYFVVCESYFEAIRSAPPSRIQQIDTGRRKLHDEGATLLRERLSDRVILDETTSRRLFTLLCALHWRG